jgi:hypothetical protein
MSRPGPPRITSPPLAWFPNTLEYTWAPPTNQGSSPITGYRLTINPGGITCNVGNDIYYKVTGLSNAFTYQTTIEASNTQGYGPPVSFMDFQTGSPPPFGPNFVSSTVFGQSSVSVYWTTPATLPDADIFWYYITGQSTSPAVPTLSTNAWALSQSNVIFENLNIFSDYFFNIQAVNCPGYSPVVSTSLLKFRAEVTGGGTITTIPGFTLRTFTSVGTTSCTISTIPLLCDLLIVGGGGGSGGGCGGAGGGGGVVYRSSLVLGLGTYTVTVGAGGTGALLSSSAGQNGGDSVFGTFTALGGGGGGGAQGNRNGLAGGSGGSGGSDGTSGTGGAGLQPTSASGGFGNAGANAAWLSPSFPGPGAGGAGQAGQGVVDGTQAGKGGDGIIVPITGTNTYYGGGGGGGVQLRSPFFTYGTSGPGGLGGGGRGAQGDNIVGNAGTPNTGGGAGAGGRNTSVQQANGGSGIVILRYRT